MEQLLNKKIARNVLLNPGPATTSIGVKEALVCPDICPREKEFGDVFRSIASMATKAVNGSKDYETVLLTCSGTGAVESCLTSCVNTNDEILILENGAYGKRMADICKAMDIKYHLLTFDYGNPLDLEKINSFLLLNPNRFKVMAFIHHETTVGILNPLNSLHDLAKEHGLVTLVDAMSSYAGVEIDLEKTPVNYLISSSNKCIQGMAGIGMVLVRKDELERIKNFKVKNYYFNLYKNFFNQKEQGQFLFTPPVQVLYSLKKAFEEFFEEGPINRINRYASLYHRMFQGMKSLGFKEVVEPEFHSKILTTFYAPKDSNYSFDSMHDYLFERGVTLYPGKVSDLDTFRVSNLGDLNLEDIDLYLNLLKEYLHKNSLRLE